MAADEAGRVTLDEADAADSDDSGAADSGGVAAADSDETDDTMWTHPHLEALSQVLVPVGFGVFTWLVVLLVAGALLSIGSPSAGALFLLVPLALLFAPVYRFRPWEPGLSERVLAFPGRRRYALAFAVASAALVRQPAVVDALGPVLRVLLLPLRFVPQALFGASVYYDTQLGRPVGQMLFAGGRLYAEFLWLYAIGLVLSVPLRMRGGKS